MKFRLLVVVCLILIITSCSKSGGSSGSGGGTPTPTLTATETSMLGTWYLKRERLVQKLGSMVIDTLITSFFSSKPYIELKSTPYSYAGVSGWDVNSKNYTDNAYLQGYGSTFQRGSITSGGAWHVDANTGFLIASLTTYQFSVNTKDLTLSRRLDQGGIIILDTLFFQK
jgi:hypothetical protein